MTRILSYDTDNIDDILWALKRVVDDSHGKLRLDIDNLKTFTDESFNKLKNL